MYSEPQMKRRIMKLSANLMLTGGFDILVTHAPAGGWGDMEDLPHQGFKCFNGLLEKYRPAYMLHGHVHQAYGHFKREMTHSSGTRIINTCGSVRLCIQPEEYPEIGKTGSPLYDLYQRVKEVGNPRF